MFLVIFVCVGKLKTVNSNKSMLEWRRRKNSDSLQNYFMVNRSSSYEKTFLKITTWDVPHEMYLLWHFFSSFHQFSQTHRTPVPSHQRRCSPANQSSGPLSVLRTASFPASLPTMPLSGMDPQPQGTAPMRSILKVTSTAESWSYLHRASLLLQEIKALIGCLIEWQVNCLID